MIDLSYLTEEEQSVIMTVLRRDADLKKAEEERIRKLGRTPASPQLNTELKNRTGEWFYEAKSLRHMDKIHGSEIILASMKQRTALDGLLRTERCKTPSSRGSDIVAPPKPARSLEPPRPPPPPQEISNAARENLNSVVRSPRTRHNPFNRDFQIVVEPADDKDDMLTSGDPESSETEPVSPLKSRPAETSQPSGGSITSEGSSAGFRPVPKKRTFLSRRTSGQSESNGVASDAPRGSGMVVPVPRRGLQRESSESSSQSYPKGQEEIPQISVSEVPDPAQPTKPLDEKSQQPLCHVSTPQRERNPPSLRDRPATSTRSDAFTDPETSQQSNGRHGDNGSIQDANRGILSSAGSATRQEVPSLPQSTVDPDPPESYYLNFIDKSDQQEQKKSNQKQAFQLSTQTASPTGDEEGFNAKVLDWFSRSTDSLDWLKTEEGPKSSKSSNRHVETSRLRGEESFRKDDGRTESVDDRGPKPDSVPAETPHAPISKWKGIHDESASNLGDDREQKDSGPGLVMINNDSDNLKSAGGPQEAGQRGSDAKILCVARLSPKPRILVQSDPQPDSVSQTGDSSMRDELSKTIPALQLDPDQDFGRLYGSRNLPNIDYKQGDAQTRRGSGEDLPSPKPKEDTSNKDITNPRGPAHPESTAEKIKQLKSFWEQERKRPSFYKPKALGDGKAARGTKLNKRYAKSEYDLTSLGKDSGSDEGDAERNHNFTVSPLNQKMDNSSLGGGRTQFNNLRDFWGEAMSNGKGSKIPKRKEPISGQLSFPESKSDDPEIQSEKTRLAAVKSSPPLPRRLKSPHDRPPWSKVANEPPAESKKSSKEEKPTRSLNSGREIRSPKSRKDSLGNSSSRGNSLRRATSMFALSDPDDLQIDVHSGSRKQRQGADKGLSQRRSAEEPETATPRARACVPRDFRHYLGMTDQSAVHSSLAPAPKDEGSGGKSGYQFELGGPVRASTPVNVEERHGRRSAKTSQRPLWASYNSSDAGQESSVSSMSETWSSGRNGSNRENDIEGQNAIRNALRRAEARPKTLAKSMEDITASLSPRQERRQDETADKRCLSDESSIPSPSSSLFSEPEHLKKMSKSVPSFLQKEVEDTDSTCEDIHVPGRPVTGRSLKNLTGSSSMASLSGSVMTMYSDFGNVEVQGNIQFSINYVQRLREFHIFVAQCRDLAAVDPKRGRSDPYVKSYLVPDKANLGKRKTSVKKKTLNPTFNEILRYRVRMEYLRTQTLILSVWHHDTFGRNSFLGEVDVDLAKWDFDHTQMNYLALKARTAPTLAPSHGRGEMRLAVRFLPEIVHSEVKDGPNTGELHIWVKECKNLPPIRPIIDPYVKCFVLPDTSRKSRQKTRVLRRTADPAFNHTMVYDGIRQGDLSEACVELTVWDRDRLASNLLGGLRIGVGSGRSYGAPVDWMDSTPYEAALWERMMATPNEWVEDQLPLRAFNCSKTHFK